MQSFLKYCGIVGIALSLAACEKHLEHNQDAPARDRVPPNSEAGTPVPKDPPPVAPASGSKGTTPTGTR